MTEVLLHLRYNGDFGDARNKAPVFFIAVIFLFITVIIRAKRGMDDNFFMKDALREAQKAFDKDEVPVGAVAVYKNQIIGRGHNQNEQLQDPTAHAEILAITAAANALGSWRLNGVEIFTTVEPCTMCAGALVLARVKRIIFGARDEKFGGCGSIFNIVSEKRLNHQVQITAGVMEKEAASLMKSFFEKKRKRARRGILGLDARNEEGPASKPNNELPVR